ncbi:hypothetical protein [Campylobacter jejuni]
MPDELKQQDQQQDTITLDIPPDTQTQTVILTDEQFTTLIDGQTALIDGQAEMNNNLFWIACTLVAIMGILLIKTFWDGWRSHR